MKPHNEVYAPSIRPMLTLDDVAATLAISRRTAERLKSAGGLPRPDLHVGRMPRWKPSTIDKWIDGEAAGVAKGGRS